MNLEYIISVVNDSNTDSFAVTINGEVVVKRLFVSYRGFLCEFARESNNRGHIIANFHLKKWERIRPILGKGVINNL